MAPSATETPAPAPVITDKKIPFKTKTLGDHGSTVPTADEALPELRTEHREPLKPSGALDQYEHFDVTPIIGREFVNVNLAEFLRAPNSDELIRDLAITSTYLVSYPYHYLYD